MATKREERPVQAHRARDTTNQKKTTSPYHQRVDHSHHQRKRRRSRDSLLQETNSSVPTMTSSSPSTMADYYSGSGARVTRTAGITGLLTLSEQHVPRSPTSTSASSQVNQRQSPAQAHHRQSPAQAHQRQSPAQAHQRQSPAQAHQRQSPAQAHQRQSPAAISASPTIHHSQQVHRRDHMPLKPTLSAPANAEGGY